MSAVTRLVGIWVAGSRVELIKEINVFIFSGIFFQPKVDRNHRALSGIRWQNPLAEAGRGSDRLSGGSVV
ncbi:hypothetical protein PISMIDRAFT_156603 [Pisolithus microcarpus 441]|uniref:Uncharacterized protein n=1 Tax=Pisolithus microcarpus 441 TaxID=765257 RepID=A0A0C9YRI8_9AGAM|nr:hypothetical protein PISMIDRAFT_156603 [Pisolithus microcarpus 441]